VLTVPKAAILKAEGGHARRSASRRSRTEDKGNAQQRKKIAQASYLEIPSSNDLGDLSAAD
jgi:hypothetical protein